MRCAHRFFRHSGWLAALIVSLLTGPAAAQEADSVPKAEDERMVFRSEGIDVTADRPNEAERKAYMKQLSSYQKLRMYVRNTLPLAHKCAAVVEEIDQELATMEKKRQQRKYIKRRQNELFEQYEDQLRDLNSTEGKILLKLVNRETGNSAFRLIKEYKSGATATVWQLLAKVYGLNLKQPYDPAQNAAIEKAVREVEATLPDIREE